MSRFFDLEKRKEKVFFFLPRSSPFSLNRQKSSLRGVCRTALSRAFLALIHHSARRKLS